MAVKHVRKTNRPVGVSKKALRKITTRERIIFKKAQEALATGDPEKVAEVLMDES